MGYIQGAARNQIVLLPDCLDDYVGKDNEVRAIDAFVDSLDIGELGKDEIKNVLGYLERRKGQLSDALKRIEETGGNQICTTDSECRLMKTRDDIRPSFNVQTAVEPDNHLIVHYDVTNECTDWNLLKAGIDASKKALGVDSIEGIADRGYSNTEQILDCLLAGDTPTTHPNKGEKSRMFRFKKNDIEVTEEMLASDDLGIMKQCISAGVLPNVLKRENIEIETFKRRETGSSVYLNKETGELVSYSDMKAAGGLDREQVEVKREEPVQKYFKREIEKDTVICPMGQKLFYAGLGSPNGKRDDSIRRYHRVSACERCKNKCTMGKRRVISFKEGEIRKDETFYDRAKEGKIYKRTNHDFKALNITEEESKWDVWIILRYYPNQQHLRKRNTIVEHPYGTVKRWHGAGYLLTKGKVKVAAEMGLSFLAYNFRRVINILGTQGIMELVMA